MVKSHSNEILAKAKAIQPFEICYVETEGEETWVHICLVNYTGDHGLILLLDEAQMVIDYEGQITFLWALPDGENRVATMGSYKKSPRPYID